MLDGDHYILINLYNANTETQQCKIFNELQSLLNFFDINQNKRIIFAGDFNIFFSSKLEARDGKSIIKLVDIKESLDICDIWRIRNPKRQNFTFRQNHSTGFIERQLDYYFVSNCLQEFVNYTDVLPATSTDQCPHSPVLISLSSDNSDNNGRSLWIYNSSLVYDEFYVENMKKLITKINTSSEFLEDAEMKWEFLKYEIRKFTIDYSKTAAKIRKQHKIDLEQKLKNFEKNLTSEENRKLYNHYKSELETIYDHIADDIKIRSKCEWYEHGEKSTKFFLNLVKKRGVQSRIRKFIAGEKEITDHKELSKNIKAFYETLFKRNFSKTNVEKQRFLNYLSNKTLTNEQYDLRENKISETDLFDSMKSMKNNKTPGNDGLTK